ncbi:MAG: hypothetical protein AB7E47_01995 [Desulfovibrionaceae bacterium]
MTAKPLTVAFLYNVRHTYPDPADPRTQLETDFDDPATIEAMIAHLEHCGYEVIPIEADRAAYLALHRLRERIDVAFNYAEGIYGHDRECHLPAMLEMLQIPYTGSTPLTQALVLHKAKAKDLLGAHGVPVLPHQVFRSADEPLAPGLGFPLIVKPLAQGSSAGITNKSVVEDDAALRAQLAAVLDTFGGQAFVEPFVDGREFSIGMLGAADGGAPTVLPWIEPNHAALPEGYHKIDSLEVKWVFEEQAGGSDYLRCPPEVPQRLKARIDAICLAVWDTLEMRDFCRIDLRCDRDGNPYVLEVNSPAGLIPPAISTTSYFPLACRTAGLDYEAMLQRIIASALARPR